MKRFKRFLPALLAVILLISGSLMTVTAASVQGRSESTPIDLKLSKSKDAKFQKGQESVYFWVELKKSGKLKVSFSAKSLGTGATMILHKQGDHVWKQTATLKYKKSTKTTSGSLTSEYILPTGGYVIEVTPGKSLKTKKTFTISTKFTEVVFDDVEPNNTEDTAQPMTVGKRDGKTVSYNMFLSTAQLVDQEDIFDCFRFKLKETKKLHIKLKFKEKLSGIKVLLRKKTADGYETVQMYDVANGSLDKKVSLKKGTYYLKVWYVEPQGSRQAPYTISASAE